MRFQAGHLGAVIVAFAVMAATAAPAQQFSADVIETPARGATTTRVYMSATKMRFQTLEGGQPAGGAIFDASQNTTTIVDDKDRTYFGGADSPVFNAMLNQAGAPPILQFFRPANPSDPCAGWNVMFQKFAQRDTSAAKKLTCTNQGSDAVNQRPAQKWQVVATHGAESETGYFWIDSKLGVVSKSQEDKGETMELKNVVEGPQPDAEFQVPPGYTKVDEAALLEKLKSSPLANGSVGGIFGSIGSSAKNGAVEGAKEGAAEAAKDKTKAKIKKLFHVP